MLSAVLTALHLLNIREEVFFLFFFLFFLFSRNFLFFFNLEVSLFL